MTALQMLSKLVMCEEKTLGEGKRIVKYLNKISKGQKLTLTEFNFVTKLYNKYCESKFTYSENEFTVTPPTKGE